MTYVTCRLTAKNRDQLRLGSRVWATFIFFIPQRTRYRPRVARQYAPRWQFGPKFTADLRPSADGSAVRLSLVTSGGQAAGSQCAYSLGSCAMGQTDGRIALFQNTPCNGGLIIANGVKQTGWIVTWAYSARGGDLKRPLCRANLILQLTDRFIT